MVEIFFCKAVDISKGWRWASKKGQNWWWERKSGILDPHQKEKSPGDKDGLAGEVLAVILYQAWK